jgi:hypothetical protein
MSGAAARSKGANDSRGGLLAMGKATRLILTYV